MSQWKENTSILVVHEIILHKTLILICNCIMASRQHSRQYFQLFHQKINDEADFHHLLFHLFHLIHSVDHVSNYVFQKRFFKHLNHLLFHLFHLIHSVDHASNHVFQKRFFKHLNPICPGAFLSEHAPGWAHGVPPCVNPDNKMLLT